MTEQHKIHKRGKQGWQGASNRFDPAKPISLSSMRYQYSYLDVPMCLADQSCSALPSLSQKSLLVR